MINQEFKIFFNAIETSLRKGEFVRLTLSNRKDDSYELIKLIVKLIQIRKGLKLSFIYRYEKNDIAKNFDFKEGISLIKDMLGNDFLNADLFTTIGDYQLRFSRKGKIKLQRLEPNFQKLPSLNHDRSKLKWIKLENNIYLKELGIINSNWQIKKNMHDKYRQINKYIEIIDSLIKETELSKEIRIVDMGSGKGYLTFALYDYLTNILNIHPKIIGVELRKDLVNTCNNTAKKANFCNLSFQYGAIENFNIEKVDILIALHACDTATDEAIYKGITASSKLIICAPCCHKQIRKQFNVINEFGSFLKYAETFEGHRISALAWSKLGRAIEIELSLHDKKRKPCRDFLKVCRSEYDNLLE
ncbi:MAG: SAM-dependent methyltransferase, partial [Candidatus Hermodarchaeota archaeon]